jgi:hypothetical protein
MLLGANAFLADIDVVAPTAAGQVFLFAHGATNTAGLEHICDNMSGIGSPRLQDFAFFPHFLELFVG